ncbi:MAG: phospholipase D-like domain-containing protein [Aeromicrobium erythreum]
MGFLLIALVVGLGSTAPSVALKGEDSNNSAVEGTGEDTDNSSTLPSGVTPQDQASTTAAAPENWYGEPPLVEANFARPVRAISSYANSDFSQLNDLERLIRGSYRDPNTGKDRPSATRKANTVYMSISRMENSYRVGRELIAAARKGVTVRVIHGKASQSKESRWLQRELNKTRTGKFKICAKGRSNACLAQRTGAIMHSKILMVKDTFDRDKVHRMGAFWSGSANLGGPSGERTWNNGWTIYNDKKIWVQMTKAWADMWAERNVNDDYPYYVRRQVSRDPNRYGISAADAVKYGYNSRAAYRGVFYSNRSNVTYYMTPIYATPTNGRDPVMAMLKRVIPDSQCRIYLQENRFKYRRIAVAQKLVELANKGCRIEAIAFRDDLKVNRIDHCQQWIRICKPILDEFRRANVRIPAAWAKPHDKTILVDAKMKPNAYNPAETLPNGQPFPSGGERIKLVQAGSAALTGSNLVVSDEITTETTNPAIFDQYLEHWKAINRSREFHAYAY